MGWLAAYFVSGSLTVNWLETNGTPSRDQLGNFLSANGFNFSVGFWGGASSSYTPGAGWAKGFGLVSPQAGASYNYSFQGGNTGFSW
jgi:hypothetical protein